MDFRKNLGRKVVSEKTIISNEDKETLLRVLSQQPDKILNRVVTSSEYVTNGEEFIVVKDIDYCKIQLDSVTTNHITIKALTKVLIVPDVNRIDEYYDEIFIDKGACVEFVNMENSWYIMSSDGLKLT
jgi:hypothetical protein